MSGVILLALLAQEPVPMPAIVGQNLYTGTKPLRRQGLVLTFQQVERDTEAGRQFFITAQRPDSGKPVKPGDTVLVQFNCVGMLRYWQDWAVPLLGDFTHNVQFIKATKKPMEIVVPEAEYPLSLVGTGFGGDAKADLLIDYDGSVIAARIIKSSGFPAADSSACEAALHSTFSPGENYGEKCRVWATIPYHWEHVEKQGLKSSKPVQGMDINRDQY